MSLVGRLTERNLCILFVDKVFLSTDSFDTRQDIFTPNIDEAHLKGTMINISREVILVTNSSKFKRKSLALICGLDKIKIIATGNFYLR